MSLNRREFLMTSTLAAAGWSAITTPAADAPRRRRLKKGFMWGCIPGSMSVLEKFKLLQQAGFDGVEIDSGLDHGEVLKARDATGLTIASVVDAVHWHSPLSDPDSNVRAAGLEGLQTALRDAKAYGATSVLLVPAVVNQTVAYNQAWSRSVAEIKKAIPLAEDWGIRIAVENVWNGFLLSPLEAARYIDQFQSRAMNWHFDVGNSINNGWPEQWLHILGKRVFKLHIKEYSRKKRDAEGLWKGFEVEYLEGDNNWPAVMKALDDIGYEGWGTAEPAWSPPGVPFPERLAQVSRKLDEIFAL